MIWIYGASGHGKVIYDCLIANRLKVAGFIDDNPQKKEFLGRPVLRANEMDMNLKEIIIGIGENNIRKSVAELINSHFIVAIHPSAVVSPNSTIGEGTAVISLSAINSGSTIGKHCIINTRASVDHDCTIGDYVHIAPGAIICGSVTIDCLSWIGAGAVVRENLTIGRNVMIGAGSVIVRNIPDNAVVYGVPGRIIRYK
jgi:acetyltransferase EpsM